MQDKNKTKPVNPDPMLKICTKNNAIVQIVKKLLEFIG